MRLYVIRHGDPDYANDTLTAKGIDEATALAAYLEGEGVRTLYSSPLGRAQATARLTAERMGLPITTEPWTAELSLPRCPNQNLVAWDQHGHIIRKPAYLEHRERGTAVPELMMAHAEIDAMRQFVAANADAFFARQGFVREGGVYRVTGRNADRLALFCHGGFGLTLLAHLLEVPLPTMWAAFFLHTSSVTIILFDERTPGIATPRCLGLGMLSHLYATGQTPSRAGIIGNWE